jgi:hypothetical protein
MLTGIANKSADLVDLVVRLSYTNVHQWYLKLIWATGCMTVGSIPVPLIVPLGSKNEDECMHQIEAPSLVLTAVIGAPRHGHSVGLMAQNSSSLEEQPPWSQPNQILNECFINVSRCVSPSLFVL